MFTRFRLLHTAGLFQVFNEEHNDSDIDTVVEIEVFGALRIPLKSLNCQVSFHPPKPHATAIHATVFV